MRVLVMAAMAATLSTPAFAQDAEVNYREGALGFEALQNADYEKAEEQLLEANGVSRNDPARLINLGQVFAATGRNAEAELMFERAIKAKRTYLVLANGEVVDSRDAARAALAKLGE